MLTPTFWAHQIIENMYLRATKMSRDRRLLVCPLETIAPSVAFCLLVATGYAMGTQVPSFPSPAPPHSLLLKIVEVFCKEFSWEEELLEPACSAGPRGYLWWWAGNWIIRHTFPLMGFLPPCLCRSFGRIKVSTFHSYVKEKSSVKKECSYRIQEKFCLVWNFMDNLHSRRERLPVAEAEGWVLQCLTEQLQNWSNSGRAVRKPGKLCPAIQGSDEEDLGAVEVAHT